MNEFDYARPTTLDEAIGLLSQHNGRAAVLAGGTDLIVHLREGGREADIVVDVKRIPELSELEYSPDNGLTLGASVPCFKIYGDEAIAAAYGALADAARIIGGWQIQSRASVGGNLCNSSPAADTIPPLYVHRATCEIVGPKGRRTLPVEDFCVSPGRNALEPGEMLVALKLPATEPHSASAYQRFIPRNEMDIAVAGAASWVRLDAGGQTIENARVALAAVAPTPVFADAANEWLAGKPANHETFQEAGKLAQESASPIDDVRGPAEYRRHLVGVLTRRTLAGAVERAKSQG